MAIGDPRVREEERGLLWQPGVHAPHHPCQALPRPHAQHLLSISFNDSGTHRRRRQTPVTGHAQIPLHATGEPAITKGKVAELDSVGLEQQFRAAFDLLETPQSASQAREEHRAKMGVAEFDAGHCAGRQGPVVVVLMTIRQRAGRTIHDESPLLLTQESPVG